MTENSTTEPITAVLPCRAGSERVKHKNTRPFGGFNNGLLELKLKQLSNTEDIEEIIVSTNDPIVSEIASPFSGKYDSRVRVVERPDELGRSTTPMSEFIKYLGTLKDSGTMLMTHVTHPFVTHSVFKELIHAWRGAAHRGYDSLLTVTNLHTFLWDKGGKPFNYDSSVEKWPRSQDIAPLFEINHVAHLISFAKMLEVSDWVGEILIRMRWRVTQ